MKIRRMYDQVNGDVRFVDSIVTSGAFYPGAAYWHWCKENGAFSGWRGRLTMAAVGLFGTIRQATKG